MYVCMYACEHTDQARCTTQQKNKVRSKCDIVFWYLLMTCLRCDVIFTEGHTVRPQLPAWPTCAARNCLLAQLNGSAGEYQHLHCVVQVLAFALCCCASINICTVLYKYQQLDCVVVQTSTFALCCINISSCTVLFASISICTDFVHMHISIFCLCCCAIISIALCCQYYAYRCQTYEVTGQGIMPFWWTLTDVRHMKLLVRGSCLFLLHSYGGQTYEVTGQGIMHFSVALLQVLDIWSYWSGDHAFFCRTLTGVRHMKLLVRGSCLFLLHSYGGQTYEVTGQGIMPFSVALLRGSDIWSYWSGDHAFFCCTLTGVGHMKLLVRGSCLFLSHSYGCQTYEVTGEGIMPFSVTLLQVSNIWRWICWLSWSGGSWWLLILWTGSTCHSQQTRAM